MIGKILGGLGIAGFLFIIGVNVYDSMTWDERAARAAEAFRELINDLQSEADRIELRTARRAARRVWVINFYLMPNLIQ